MVLNIKESSIDSRCTYCLSESLPSAEIGGVEGREIDDGDFGGGAVAGWGVENVSEDGPVGCSEFEF